ncbi:hypothetical protein BJV78DRAFT_1287290 [Lactifluus subvellereus]|nr:hypothetical protein BJV78DRAFT_1287290 [Lactifluus subvellereus]
MSVSGNDVSGSVFYAFPLVAAAGIYSSQCLLTASLLLFFRPLLLEFASTVRINGSIGRYSCRDTAGRYFTACVAFLGVTGFECTPSYIEVIRPKDYPAILRNLIIASALLNTVLCFLACALLPVGINVLSALGSLAGGSWLSHFVTTIQLLDRMAHDHPTIATLFSSGLSLVLYVDSGMSLSTVSYVFSVTFLFQILLFAVSSLLLKVNRPCLSRPPHSGTFTLLVAFVVVIVTWVGNVVLAYAGSPPSLWLWFVVFFVALPTMTAQPSMDSFCYLLAVRDGDETAGRRSQAPIHVMLRALLSVEKNIPDARTVVFVHAYRSIGDIPSELHPNARLLDEAFPTITVDLAFAPGNFNPALVEVTSRTLDVPRSRMCVVSLSRDHPWELGEYGTSHHVR